MGNEFEVYRDAEGINHLIFDQSALYDDSQIGDKITDFEVLRIIGSFNNKNPISKVRCIKNNKIYAMKKIDLDLVENKDEKKLVRNQMERLKTIDHPHLLKYYKTFEEENKYIYLIYEYMNNSDLNSLIKAHSILDKHIKEETIWNILLQCLSGLNYLHKQNLSSLAISPTNIYLNNEQNTKISLFYDLAKPTDKNYDKQKDIYFIGKYFYKMCFLEKDEKKDKWISDIQVVKKETQYSKELMDIIYSMSEDAMEQKNASQLYDIAKDAYVKKFTKITSIDSVLNCLFSFSNLYSSISSRKIELNNNIKRYYISYWFLNSIEAINSNNNSLLNNKSYMDIFINKCYEEFRRVLASANSKIDCSKEVDPVFLFAFLLEKMHKELNKKVTTIVANQNSNEQYIINSIYRIEEKVDKSNKPEVWNNFQTYMTENLNSEISKFFYGVKKYKNVCSQCRNAVYSFSNFFCIPFDLTKPQQNNIFQLCSNICQIKRQKRTVCEVCLTEQNFNEFEDYYIYPQNLAFCFYRGTNNLYNTYIDFPEILTVSEAKGKDQMIEVQFQLIGTVNRIINQQNEEEYIYFCRKYNQNNNTSFWYSRPNFGPWQGFPLNVIQQSGQIIMLFYNKLS